MPEPSAGVGTTTGYVANDDESNKTSIILEEDLEGGSRG